jgi:hypothetical protein
MARSVPTFVHEAVNVGGSGAVASIFSKFQAALESIDSNGEQAWELHTRSSTDLLWHSVGDRGLGSGSSKGDRDIWIRSFIYATTISWRVMMDYSPASDTWFRITGNDAYDWSTLSDSLDYEYWFWGNEYEVVFCVEQSGAYYEVYFGAPHRLIDNQHNGIARITSQSGTGDGVVFGVDRDLTGELLPGGMIMLVNQTPDSTSLELTEPQIVQVVSISASQIVCDGVLYTYSAGSLLGHDPAFVGVNTSYNQTHFFSITNSDATFYLKQGQDNIFYNPDGMETVSGCNPNANGFWGAAFVMLVATALEQYVGAYHPRGWTEFLLAVRYDGTMNDQDTIQVDGDSNNQYKLLVNQWSSAFTNYRIAIGPGV